MILFVCHANICRSPMAERLAAGLVGGRVPVGSAGTHAVLGEAMHPGAAQALREAGADPVGHASRPLTAELLAAATLVLTATRAQRAACAITLPAALGRMFTLRQFGRLSHAVDATAVAAASTVDGWSGRLEALRAEAARVRGGVQPVPADEDDLADPVNGTLDDVRACLATIRTALAPWLSLVDTDPAAGHLTGGPRSAGARWPGAPAGSG
jgi:protein-tyrosine phosphatase